MRDSPCWRSLPLERALIIACALLFGVTIVAGSAFAKRAPDNPGAPEIIPGEPEARTVTVDGMRLNQRTGTPVAIYGQRYALTAAEPEVMARQYLRDHRDLLRLADPELHDLAHHMTRVGQATTTVRFNQHLTGIPVYESNIAVTVDRDNRVIFVANSYKPAIGLASTVPTVAATTARQMALDHFGITGELAFERLRLVVYPHGGDVSLAHEVRIIPRTAPHGDWEMIVDAQSGAILKAVDRANYATGNGNIFDPDPLSSAGAAYGDPGFVDGGDATTPQLDGERVNATLLDITDNGGTFELNGPYAEIVDTESPFNGLYSQAGSSSWEFNRFDDDFEAVLCYWHVDNIMRYINETLLVPVSPIQYAGGARYDPHGLGGADNSHYTSGNGVIAFGEGGVDDSEDADVVIHELGHALHDWLTGGNLSQVNGLSEGTGDYIAQSYSRSLGQWTPADPAYHWVFSWDGHNPFWGGRTTNYGATYPGGLTGSIHTDGQIWSTCLMKIWDEIGRDQIDRALYVGLTMTNGSTSQEDAANAVLNAAIALGYPASDISSIVANFQNTGYNVGLPADIDVTPLSLAYTLLPNAQGVEVLTIANTADPGLGGSLDFSLGELEGILRLPDGSELDVAVDVREPAGRDHPDVPHAKGFDDRTGDTQNLGAGGPDGFGYIWIDSNEAGGPTFDWTDITGVGTSVSLSDDGSVTVALPFPFPFYGNIKNSVLLSANGYLTFGTDGNEYNNLAIPSGATPNDLVAGFWDDLNPNLGGTIHRYHDAPNNRYIIQWTNIQHFGGSSPYTFQIILNADGTILYQYLTMSGQLNSCTIGIENSDASTGLQVVFNGAYVENNLAILIQQSDCPWLSEDPTSGTVPPLGSVEVDVTADATGLANGTYECTLVVISNDPDEGQISIPVTLVVTGNVGVGSASVLPAETRLVGNTPNPFNPMTEIRYELAENARVELSVFDTAGRHVRTLVHERQEAGDHSVRWDGRDDAGRGVASGVYFYQLDAGSFSETRRAVLLR